MGGGVPSDYFVLIQLLLWLFCCWAVTIPLIEPYLAIGARAKVAEPQNLEAKHVTHKCTKNTGRGEAHL